MVHKDYWNKNNHDFGRQGNSIEDKHKCAVFTKWCDLVPWMYPYLYPLSRACTWEKCNLGQAGEELSRSSPLEPFRSPTSESGQARCRPAPSQRIEQERKTSERDHSLLHVIQNKTLTRSISFFFSTISLLSMVGGLFRPKLCGIVVKNFEESSSRAAFLFFWFKAASISSNTSKPFAICTLLSLPKGIFLMSVSHTQVERETSESLLCFCCEHASHIVSFACHM